jgi:hypothetical protein
MSAPSSASVVLREALNSVIPNLSPSQFIKEWDLTSVTFVIVFAAISLMAFVLSVRNYPEGDDTPAGMKLLYALLAAAWNVGYVAYYFVTVHIMGLGR